MDKMDLDNYLDTYGRSDDEPDTDEVMNLEDYLAAYGRKAAAAASQKTGADGEDVAENALRAYGVRMVEQIATPYVITDRKRGGWVKMIRKAKVSGDRRGVMGDGSGRRVLAEVKSTTGDRIAWSRLEDHQVRALDENNRLGAVSLLIVVFSGQAFVLRWPVDGFLPRTSITRDTAIEKQWDGEL